MPKFITIEGKRYTKKISFKTKKKAKTYAETKRKKGFLIRVIPIKTRTGKKYGIYQRGNEKRR